jgi:hypothetical protein
MILKTISKPANDRIIHWLWSKKGGVGKSMFSKYLCIKHDALILSGKTKDMFYGIVSYDNDRGYAPETIIIDLSRTSYDFANYDAIESIKNGLFFSSKYESNMYIMNSPHVFVFANREPDLEAMSKDRWDIMELK